MLQAIRDKAQGWIAWVIVILISIPFALWGIQEYLGAGGDAVVAEVDGVEIESRELDQGVQRYRAAIRERLGASYDPEMFPDEMIRRQVLDGMIRDLVIAQSARQLGLRAGDDMVRQSILTVPAFQRAGQFDNVAYEAALRNQGYSPAAFEQRMREDLAAQLLETGIVSGALVTERELDDYLRLRDQQRDFSFVTVNAAGFADSIVPTEDEIKAYYDANQAAFMRAERAKVDYLELDLDRMAAELEVDREALMAYYEAHKVGYTAPEQRRVRHILVTVEEGDDEAALAKAQDLVGRLEAGADFADLAQAESKDPGSASAGGDLGLIGRGAMVEAFEEAAFSLEPEDISEPVKSEFGYHIIQVTEVVPERVQTFEEAFDRVSAEYRKNEAEHQFYDYAERLTDLSYEHPESLEPAAEALGLAIQHSDWITRDGGAAPLDNPKTAAAAFSEDVLGRGNNSEPVELETTHLVVLRVVDHQEAMPRPLDEVSDQIRETLRSQQASAQAADLARQMRERIEGGADIQTVAADNGLEVTQRSAVARRGGDVPPGLAASVFRVLRPGDGGVSPGTAALANGDHAVFVVTQVTDADPAALGEDERAALRARLAGTRAQQAFELFVEQHRAESQIDLLQSE